MIRTQAVAAIIVAPLFASSTVVTNGQNAVVAPGNGEIAITHSHPATVVIASRR
jgi:hypothetical protein